MKRLSFFRLLGFGLTVFGCCLLVIALMYAPQSADNIRSYPRGFVEAIERQRALKVMLLGVSSCFTAFGMFCLLCTVLIQQRKRGGEIIE